jgi:hypothetical protein
MRASIGQMAGPGRIGDPSKNRLSLNADTSSAPAAPVTRSAISLPAPGPMPNP